MPEYGQLDNPSKIRAVLAAVQEPVTRPMVLDFAGIDRKELKPEESQAVEQIFAETVVNPTSPVGRRKFWYPMERREAIFTSLDIDPKTVHGQIADVLMKNLGFDL